MSDHYGHDGQHGEDYDEMFQLHRSQTRGIWGIQQPLFQLNQLNTNNNPLIWIDLPPWMARTWTITLLAMRYQAGAQSTFNGYSIDQQAVPTTFTGIGGGQPLQLSMDYGISNASERGILMDYPWSGAAFEVTAASLQLKIAPFPLTTPLATIPSVGAFIAPRARGGGQLKQQPTFTTSVGVVPTSNVNVPIPARARAYNIAAVNGNGTVGTLTVTQQTTPASTATVVRQDTLTGDSLTGAIAASYPYFAGALVFNAPIHPLATVINIANTAASGQQNYVIRFELDLG